jgi:hypothetical protein
VGWILRTAAGDGADGRVHNRIKIVKKHGPWNRAGSSPRINGDRDGICRSHGQHAPPRRQAPRSASTAPSNPSRQTAAAATSMAFTESRCQLSREASFFGQPKAALRVDLVPLGTPAGGRIKAFVMSDASLQRRGKVKLRELIERASSAADANLHRGIKPYPLGFAVGSNGSKFAFEPQNIEDNDAVVALIRTLFLQRNVVCYVLTLGAVSEGKPYVPQGPAGVSGAS